MQDQNPQNETDTPGFNNEAELNDRDEQFLLENGPTDEQLADDGFLDKLGELFFSKHN